MKLIARRRRLTPVTAAFTRAFTLVELLVVIGVIAVLIGILLPVLGKARESAIAIQCMSNLRQFAAADQVYVNTYNWHMPGWWVGPTGGAPNAYNAYSRYWGGLTDLRKTLSIPVLFPMSVGYSDPAGADPLVTKPSFRCYVPQKWYCANAARAAILASSTDPDTKQNYFPLHYSYGMNITGVDYPEHAANPDAWDPRAKQANPNPTIVPNTKRFHGFKPAQVKRPGDKIHFADAMYMVINVYGVGPNTAEYRGWHAKISNYDITGENPADGGSSGNPAWHTQRSIAWRHKKGANVVFFDGHGEWMRRDTLWDRDASGKMIANQKIWYVMK